MGQRGPDLLPADQPALAAGVEAGAGLDVGQVRARARLGIALAPERLALKNARQQALALLGRAERGEGRADQPFANMAHAPGAAGAGIFLVEDHLLADAQATPTVFRSPAHPDPATARQFPLPGFALGREAVFVARATTKAQLRKFTLQVRRQPAGDLLAECFV